jgi:hypothetical protein
MKRILIESPFKGDIERNVNYARLCLEDSLKRGEAPILSHLLYTQVLNDNIEEERNQGVDAGLAWLEVAERHVFYIDFGLSKGMKKALDKSNKAGRVVIFRKILIEL